MHQHQLLRLLQPLLLHQHRLLHLQQPLHPQRLRQPARQHRREVRAVGVLDAVDVLLIERIHRHFVVGADRRAGTRGAVGRGLEEAVVVAALGGRGGITGAARGGTVVSRLIEHVAVRVAGAGDGDIAHLEQVVVDAARVVGVATRGLARQLVIADLLADPRDADRAGGAVVEAVRSGGRTTGIGGIEAGHADRDLITGQRRAADVADERRQLVDQPRALLIRVATRLLDRVTRRLRRIGDRIDELGLLVTTAARGDPQHQHTRG